MENQYKLALWNIYLWLTTRDIHEPLPADMSKQIAYVCLLMIEKENPTLEEVIKEVTKGN